MYAHVLHVTATVITDLLSTQVFGNDVSKT